MEAPQHPTVLIIESFNCGQISAADAGRLHDVRPLHRCAKPHAAAGSASDLSLIFNFPCL
jgi:hypothetical protein